MGVTCSPAEDENKDELVSPNLEIDTKAGRGDNSNDKIASILNDYQAENEQLRKELDMMKSKSDENAKQNEERTRQNEDVMRELGEMKALLDAKSRVIARGRLEAALLKSIVAMKASMRLCMKGNLTHHQMKRRLNMYSEVHVHEGEVLPDNYIAGCVILTYSDDKDIETAGRYQILKVNVDVSASEEKEHIFALKVSDENEEKDISFSCETAEQKEEWIKAIRMALDEVSSKYAEMHDFFTLKLEFSKQKMGIRVEERILLPEEDEEKSGAGKPRNSSVCEKISLTNEWKSDTIIKEMEKGINQILGDEKPTKICEKVEVKNVEDPCDLLVTDISDEYLIAAGLKVNCVIVAINAMSLKDMGYSEQLDLILKTPKPYTLTFKGENFLKYKPQPKYCYQSILKEVTVDGDNSVKRAFQDMIEGTPFEKELKASADKLGTIEKLLSNQRKLMRLLQKVNTHDVEL